MKDEAFDLLTMVLVLGVVISISFNLIIPLNKKAHAFANEEIYNKSTPAMENLQSKKYSDDFDGTYDYQEIILILSNQNYFIPNPRILDVGGTTFKVESGEVGVADPDGNTTTQATDATYAPKSPGTCNEIKKALDAWCNRASISTGYTERQLKKCHFRVIYDCGEVEDSEVETTGEEKDDCFALYVLALDKETGYKKYFRCSKTGLDGWDLAAQDQYNLVIDT